MDGAAYHARLSPQGPRRALCVIRPLGAAPAADAAHEPGRASGDAERRGFVRRFQQSVSDATLRERPLALCIIFLDGLADIGQLIDFSIGERLMTELLRKLPTSGDTPDGSTWYVGQIGEALLGVVVDGSDDANASAPSSARCATRSRARFNSTMRPFSSRRSPASPFSAATRRAPRRCSITRARRCSNRADPWPAPFNFIPTLCACSPSHASTSNRELRLGIEEGQIGLRYVARHELSSGRVAGIQSYMRWVHPLRGEISPSQFLPIADATGLSPAVSRAALERLALDHPTLRARFGRDIPISFGPLRQHVSLGQLLEDCRRLRRRANSPSGASSCASPSARSQPVPSGARARRDGRIRRPLDGG